MSHLGSGTIRLQKIQKREIVFYPVSKRMIIFIIAITFGGLLHMIHLYIRVVSGSVIMKNK